jgi:hypothetical protein
LSTPLIAVHITIYPRNISLQKQQHRYEQPSRQHIKKSKWANVLVLIMGGFREEERGVVATIATNCI